MPLRPLPRRCDGREAPGARDRKRQAAEVEATAKAEKAARAKARRAAKTTS
jgi:hypothetical protein